jgi:hypothetical protein
MVDLRLVRAYYLRCAPQKTPTLLGLLSQVIIVI